jgi:outer membrane phospholipase A
MRGFLHVNYKYTVRQCDVRWNQIYVSILLMYKKLIIDSKV